VANLQSTIDLIFNGVDNASEVANKLGNNLGDLAGSAQSISAPFADLAGKLAVVQTGMTALAGVIGALAFNESAKFQSSLAELQKQMDASEGSAAQFGVRLEDLALKYGQNNNELVKSAADFKAAGYDIETSISLVKSSMDLAIAGSVETSQAVDVMNRSLAGFQVPAGDVVREAQHIGDVLNKTADLTKSSFGELATGFADLSPIAKQTGLSIEETFALLSKVIDVFGSGSEAANGLKSGFLSLVDPSKEAAAAMQALGVEYKNSDGSLKSVKQVLADLAPAFNKVDDSQRLAAASTIFGKDQAAKMVQVLGTYNDAMALADKLNREAAGSIEKEVAAKLALAENHVKRTDEAFRQLLQTIGDQSLINTGGVIGSIGDLALAFRDVIRSGSLEPLFSSLRSQLGEIETLFKTVAKNLPAAFEGVKFDGLLDSLGALKESARVALEALFGPVDLNTVEGLRAALQKVVDLVEGLVRVTAGELGGFTPFLNGIGALAKSFNDAESGTQGFIGTLLGLGVGINTAAGYFEGINTALLSFIAFGPKLAQIPVAISGIATGFSAFAASSAGFATGIAGVAAGVGVLAFEITRLSGLDQKLSDILVPDWLAGYQGATIGSAAADIAEKLGLLGPAADKASAGIANLPPAFQKETEAARATRTEIDAWLDSQERGAKATGDTKAEVEALTASFKEQGFEYDALTGKLTRAVSQLEALPAGKTAEQFREIYDAANQLVPKLVNVRDANGQIVQTYTELVPASQKMGGTLSVVSTAYSEHAKQVEEATKKSNEFLIRMEEIASNERIRTIEASVSLKTAQLETDAERVKALFASIDNTISNTGDLLGSLFGQLNNADTYTKLDIKEQIDLENKRRQDALDIQRKLAEAEIDRVRAQTRALDRGDALIRIDTTGLDPAFEMLLKAFVGKIRMYLNKNMQDFLLLTT
jgi:TP901 family phage tail tape measure protein